MEEQQIINIVGSFVFENWKSVLSAFVGLIGGVVSLCWFILSLLHKKEIRMLELQLSQQRESFNQFEAIVEQRIQVLQKEAEQLKNKVVPKTNEDSEQNIVGAESNVIKLSQKSGNKDEVVEDNRLSTFLKKTDMITNTISILNGFI